MFDTAIGDTHILNVQNIRSLDATERTYLFFTYELSDDNRTLTLWFVADDHFPEGQAKENRLQYIREHAGDIKPDEHFYKKLGTFRRLDDKKRPRP